MRRLLEAFFLLPLVACATQPAPQAAAPAPTRQPAAEIPREKIDAEMSDMARQIVDVQLALRQGKVVQAMALTEALQARYPGVKYLNLLKASTLTALGAHQNALAALEQVLKDYPNDPAALQLKQTLTVTH